MRECSVSGSRSWLPLRREALILRDGLDRGFWIPFTPSAAPTMSHNLKSAGEFESVVAEKLWRELELGRMAGPFDLPPFHNLRVSPLGVVPKKAEGKFRLIHHLSYPSGSSVNDGIDREESRVHYASFDRALQLVRAVGQSALLAKADIESAFRLLPVHPDCFHLLGCYFQGSYFFDMCLPMGCAISCYFFELFSSFLDGVVIQEAGIQSLLHYLDDFLFVGPAGSGHCLRLLTVFQDTCRLFAVPLSADKTKGPVTVLSFLGIEIDTVAMVFRLPSDKLSRLLSLVRLAKGAKKLQLKQLQSLLGHLVFACRVIRMGRAFCRRLSWATKGITAPHHYVRITKPMRDDLGIWLSFLQTYNGQSCWLREEVPNPQLELYTDAAGSCGFGAFFQGEWAAERWPASWAHMDLLRNLTLLELFPIIVAVELWGERLRNHQVVFWSDNMSVVQVVNKQSASSPPVVSLLRFLVLKCLHFNICVRARHVPGASNDIADALSRQQFCRFRTLAPMASLEGLPCPAHLWNLVSGV